MCFSLAFFPRIQIDRTQPKEKSSVSFGCVYMSPVERPGVCVNGLSGGASQAPCARDENPRELLIPRSSRQERYFRSEEQSIVRTENERLLFSHVP